MARLNKYFSLLQGNYLFSEVQRRADRYRKEGLKLFNLGIGDITCPLPSVAIDEMQRALSMQKSSDTLRGYGPSEGEMCLKQKICDDEYKNLGISPEEIFISSGTKDDLAATQELFCSSSKVAIADPAYPVYVDVNVLAGRSGSFLKEGKYENLAYLPCHRENNFLPVPPKEKYDLVYLCSPNNPTGTAFTKAQLKKWVDYAKKYNSIIFFDGAYEAFITSKDVPSSIYEIEGAKDVAIEFRSFSKMAGFTGMRLSYYIIPQNIKIDGVSIIDYWMRRTHAKYGGASYPLQIGAVALYSKEGKGQILKNINIYRDNAKILRENLANFNFDVYGGVDSPYLWIKTKNNMTSWQFFDLLLEKYRIISIPGSGFGAGGEGYFRLSAFAKKEDILSSIEILKKIG